jgi:preprotein translocase subunit SecA
MGCQRAGRQWLDQDTRLYEDRLRGKIVDQLDTIYGEKTAAIGEKIMRHFEKTVMLQVLDNSWKEHLAAMDHLRQGIHLRGYAQKDPKQEYKREAFEMFTNMLDEIKHEVIGIVSKVQVHTEEEVKVMEEQNRAPREMQYQHAEVSALGAEPEEAPPPEPAPAAAAKPYIRDIAKVGRNDPCPCGSGKKFKQCHGKLD